MLPAIFLVGLTAAGEVVLWFAASAGSWSPTQSPLAGACRRVLPGRGNQNAAVGGKPAGPGRMLGKEIHGHVMQRNQPFMALGRGNASSIATGMSFMACGFTEHLLEKHLTRLSWKGPAEKNLEATVDFRLNISSSLLFSSVRQSPWWGHWEGHGQLPEGSCCLSRQ